VIPETVTCIPFLRDAPGPRHDLLRAFRAGDPGAFAEVHAQVRLAVAPLAARLFGPGTIAVAVPGHRSGSVNAPCESLIRALAAEFSTLLPGPGVLMRIRDAPEAKAGERRDPAAEAATLSWEARLVPARVRRVLLVDDVVRSGATLWAARAAVPTGLASGTVALAVFHAMPADAGATPDEHGPIPV
jgi:hypothetical protein